MAKRVKVKTGITDTEFNDALSAYASADARLCKINADLDVKITELRKKCSEEIEELTATRESSLDIVKNYSIENKEVLFSKKKSMETAHGVIGFRTGTPKLKTLKGFTWSAVTNLLKEFAPDYVRSVEEPAKDKLLSDREKIDLKKMGIETVQDETFFIELKKENNEQ